MAEVKVEAEAEEDKDIAIQKILGRIVPGKKLTKPYSAHARVEPGGKKVIHIKKNIKNPYLKRHETDEVRAGIKAQKRTRKIGSATAATGAGGTHLSNEVLRKERELLRVGVKLHRSKKAGKLKSGIFYECVKKNKPFVLAG